MDIPADMYEPSPSPKKRSPVKSIREPELEESPVKEPIKKHKFNLKVLTNWNVESKKVPVALYGRVQSHSSSRPKDEENEVLVRRKLFDDVKNSVPRSYSRDLPGNRNHLKDHETYKDKEIEQLNHKIRNLIREKSELKDQLEDQNEIIKQLQQKNRKKTHLSSLVDSKVENSLLEVTFKPIENYEDILKKHKRFPREVFRLPRHK